MQFGCFYVMTVNKLDRNIKSIRKVVFVDEQGFQNEFDEIDDSDNVVHMLLCYDDESIGTCRCYKENGEYKIGRVAVLKEYRGKGLGEELVKQAEKKIYEWGGREVVLSSQVRVQGFYEKLGYVAEGDVYMDEMCPHIKMRKKLEPSSI